MKKILLVLSLITCVSLAGLSRDFTYGGITYTVLDEDARTCEAKKGRRSYVSGNFVLPEHPMDGETQFTLTSIGDYAFYECSGLRSVTIPNSVTSIGHEAFYGCRGLTTVTIPNSVTEIGRYAFHGCSGLEEVFFNAENCTFCAYSAYPAFPSTLKRVTIGDNVKTIPKSAFYGCSGLTSVTIPNSVTEIGETAFSGCSGLTSVTIGNSVTSIGSNAFKDCSGLDVVNATGIEEWLKIEFKDEAANPTYYAKKLLVGGETIRRLTIPEGTTRINAYAFINCEPLVTVNLPASFRSIGDMAFAGCTGLQRDIFPTIEAYLNVNYDSSWSQLTDGNNSEIYIGSQPLADVFDLNNIKIPSTITRIPDYAFCGHKMQSVEIPSSVVEIGKYAFCSCNNLLAVSIPRSVAKIGDSCFESCDNLSDVSILSSEAEIGSYAFARCSNLTEINLPEGLTKINEGTFYNCRILRNVEIPAGVESIGAYAYAGCPNINKFTFKGNVKSFGKRAFYYDEPTKKYYTKISELDIPDYNAWSKATFYTHESNPIWVAKTLKRNGEVINALDIDIPGDTISDYAFYGATTITDLKIDANAIGANAFYGAKTITDLKIDAKAIGGSAFSRCSGLKSITFSVTPESIGYEAFTGVLAETTEIPSANEWSLVKFYNHDSNPITHSQQFTVNGAEPKHLVIDIDQHQVSDYAFYLATQLESIKVKAAAIGRYSFYGISGAKYLYVDVDTLESQALYGAQALERIYVPHETPPGATDDVFSKYEGVKLYVPAGSVSAYENAETCWWRFLDVYESDFSGISDLFAPDYSDQSGPIFGNVIDIKNDDRSEIDYNAPYEVYTISGMRVNCRIEELSSGIYILRQGNVTKKYSVR